jgi:hypothetical protein
MLVSSLRRNAAKVTRTPRIGLRLERQGKLVSGPAIASPDHEEHAHLVEADQRFQAALDKAIARGSERIEAVESTVQLRRRTKLSR